MYTYLKFGLPRVFPPNHNGSQRSGTPKPKTSIGSGMKSVPRYSRDNLLLPTLKPLTIYFCMLVRYLLDATFLLEINNEVKVISYKLPKYVFRFSHPTLSFALSWLPFKRLVELLILGENRDQFNSIFPAYFNPG